MLMTEANGLKVYHQHLWQMKTILSWLSLKSTCWLRLKAIDCYTCLSANYCFVLIVTENFTLTYMTTVSCEYDIIRMWCMCSSYSKSVLPVNKKCSMHALHNSWQACWRLVRCFTHQDLFYSLGNTVVSHVLQADFFGSAQLVLFLMWISLIKIWLKNL